MTGPGPKQARFSSGSVGPVLSPDGREPLLTPNEINKSTSRSFSLPTNSDLRQHLSETKSSNLFSLNAKALEMMGGMVSTTGSVKRESTVKSAMSQISDAKGIPEEVCEDEQGTLSQWEAAWAIGNLLVGSGMLAMPFGFREAGWAAGGVLAAVTALMLLTGLLIGWGFEAVTHKFEQDQVPVRSRDFAALAYLAFGARGQAFIGLVFTLELWTAMETFLVMIGINMNIITGVSRTWAIVGSGVLSFILLHAPMKILAYLSMVSIVAILSAAGSFVVSGAVLLDRGDLPAYGSYHSDLNASGLLAALGLSLYGFSGHPCIPKVYWSMRDRSQFGGACLGGFAFAGVFYMTVSSVGYMFFGDFVEQSFTSNLGQDLHGHLIGSIAWLRLLAAAAFVIKLQGTMPMFLTPPLALLESSLGLPNTGFKVTVFRAVIVVLSVVLALSCQDVLSAVCGVMGCALTMTTSLVFPCAMFLRLGKMSRAAKASLGAIGCLGVAFGVQGTLDALGVSVF